MIIIDIIILIISEILMKKYLFPVLSSLAIGIFMAVFIIKQYDNNLDVTVSLKAEKLYYVQKGVYSNLENMKNNMKDFENYIYDVSDNMYYTYIGISLSKDNAVKIQNYYKENGYFRLQPENSFMRPIITDHLQILGKVVGLIRTKF